MVINAERDSNEQVLFVMEQLGFTYRAKPALRGINWRWEEGQHWAVLGANGAGKSTLAKILSAELKHYSGQLNRGAKLQPSAIAFVCFEQGSLRRDRDRKLDCAEFEESGFDSGTTVADLLPAFEARDTLYQETVELLELESLLERGIRYLSTGEFRKALFAAALLARPELLILDSPLDGLDRQTQARLGTAINSLIRRLPAVLVLCRALDEVPQACSHVLVLETGKAMAAGERDPVLKRTDVTASLSAPKLVFSVPSEILGHAKEERHDASNAIELHNVSVSFDRKAVFRDLSWTLAKGQHCMISGPNGSGKSTLLDLLTGDNHKAYGQQVSLFGLRRGSGESVWDVKNLFGRVDAKMQFAIPSGSTTLSVVLSGFFDSLGLRNQASDQQKRIAKSWLVALGLSEFGSVEFHTLSFGLQRLVLLARAMVKAPPLLLLDEATLALDAGHRNLLLRAVEHVIAQGKTQLLFVSHTIGERPSCINQHLEFFPTESGSTVRVSELS
ncbi:MAG: ATP-binding cassette domain-containing protein [Pseudomonadota bacterium]